MWKPDRSPRPRYSEQTDNTPIATETIERPADTPAQPAESTVPARTGTDAEKMLEDLRREPGFGMVVTTAGNLPAVGSSIAQRLSSEMESLTRRERQVREIQEIANQRAGDLTTDQLRRILEFMV